ncbi:MAG: TIGR02391 family protein [Elusimicrobiota bacterium]|jgi:uncharacterized protein (TIGR02391 family)|nr:TIGR02391 family protein [Elusimicrobiota bacterium]
MTTMHELELTFDPRTIEHLGLKMYSTLPPALAEIISNSYDADASKVNIILIENSNAVPQEIQVIDNGEGLSYEDINQKFLVIGRNRREAGDKPSAKFKRLPTGKKGLGKLALFGLSHSITITTTKDGLTNEFILDWDNLMSSKGAYKPKITKIEEKTDNANGTTITLKKLRRTSPFDPDALANSLSRIFIFPDNFKLTIKTPSGDIIAIDNKRKYKMFDEEFKWEIGKGKFVPSGSEYEDKIYGELLTAEKPLKPQSGLMGITLFSRGKLVNAPEFFSDSASSHFYQYLTGWISVDFIDDLDEDVISTNRQSIDWENAEMVKLRKFLSGIVSQVGKDWRKKRKDKKTNNLQETTKIDIEAWIETMPSFREIKKNVQQIVDIITSEEALETSVFNSLIECFHNVVPEYPLYHWRYLHDIVKKITEPYYKKKDYYQAFEEAMKKYVSEVRDKSASDISEAFNMFYNVFSEKNTVLSIIGDYKKSDGKDFGEDTKNNLQKGQQCLSLGVCAAGRNPLAHEEHEELKKSDLFSEKDCLDLLSLLSHLFKRLENSKKVK